MENLSYLNQIKGKRKPHLKFNTVISSANYDHLSEMITLAAEHNVETLSFETLTVHSDQGQELKLGSKQRSKLEDKVPDLRGRLRQKG